MSFQRQIAIRTLTFAVIFVFSGTIFLRAAEINGAENIQAEHDALGNTVIAKTSHTTNTDAQWYPDAGLGLFIHWGIASVRAINISWPMRDGLNGKPAQITPNNYFAMAKDFNPTHYNPDKWLKAAKAAGFVYVVLTTRHHEGFALWPSDYGDFSTKNYMNRRDLLEPYVEACRKYGLKTGFYYSPPDWYFDRSFMNFSMRKDAPPLGTDLKPCTKKKTPEEIVTHDQAYAELVRGQLAELLTRYGKIDLLWFDGSIPGATGDEVMPVSRIRQLQPGIVMNGRFHGHGDFINYERTLTATNPADGWAEYCNTWSDYWPYVIGAKYRANGFIIGQYVTCRSLHVNYLLDVGPMSDGELPAQVYTNFAILGDWMKTNGESVKGTLPLPNGESANVPATSSGVNRYLFALPKFKDNGANGHVYSDDLLPPEDATLTLSGIPEPVSVKLLGNNSPLDFSYTNQTVTIRLPAAMRTQMVDVARIKLKQQHHN